MTGDSAVLLWSQSGDYQCERGALGTCRGLPTLGPDSCIQQQQLDGPVPEHPERTTLVGGRGEGVDDEDGSGDMGTGNALYGCGIYGITLWEIILSDNESNVESDGRITPLVGQADCG